MKHNLIAILSLSVLVLSCTGKFEDYNIDPHNINDAQMLTDNNLAGSLFQQMERSVFIYRDGQYLDSDYQIMYNLCAETWAGYFSPTLGDGHNNSSFQINDGWSRSMFVNKFTYGMGAYLRLAPYCKENSLETVGALADILKVTTMHQVTDYYGPIAYNTEGNLTNTYDAQDVIYTQMLGELDSAIEALEAALTGGVTSIMSDFDIVYGGDVAKWIRFANSLRLRLAMRIVYADEALAKTEAEKSIADIYGVITSNSDNAIVSGVDHHPLYEINYNFNDADTQMGSSMDSYLNGYKDPRGTLYFVPAGDGALHGVRPGIYVSSWTDYKLTANKVSPSNSSTYPLMWMNAAEIAFLRAEGALRGWEMGGSAKEFYESGIDLSFEQWGASGAAAYKADSTSTSAAFVDVVGSASASAPSTITIAYDESADFETNLERIATQKWIALFPNGPEAWAEYRRLHYPKLLTPANNGSNGTVDTDRQIRRVPFPVSEQTENPDGYRSGVEALGGADNAGTRLWWDKKPF